MRDPRIALAVRRWRSGLVAGFPAYYVLRPDEDIHVALPADSLTEPGLGVPVERKEHREWKCKIRNGRRFWQGRRVNP